MLPKKLFRGTATGDTVIRTPSPSGTASPSRRTTSPAAGAGARSIPVRSTSARVAFRRMTVRTRISSLSAVSVPFRSFVGSVSAMPRRWASATASSRLSPSAMRPRTRLLVLLKTPRSRRKSAATRSRRPAFTTGSPPQTVALQPSPAPLSRARASSSSKASATADLLANATETLRRRAARAARRPIPPVSTSHRGGVEQDSPGVRPPPALPRVRPAPRRGSPGASCPPPWPPAWRRPRYGLPRHPARGRNRSGPRRPRRGTSPP